MSERLKHQIEDAPKGKHYIYVTINKDMTRAEITWYTLYRYTGDDIYHLIRQGVDCYIENHISGTVFVIGISKHKINTNDWEHVNHK